MYISKVKKKKQILESPYNHYGYALKDIDQLTHASSIAVCCHYALRPLPFMDYDNTQTSTSLSCCDQYPKWIIGEGRGSLLGTTSVKIIRREKFIGWLVQSMNVKLTVWIGIKKTIKTCSFPVENGSAFINTNVLAMTGTGFIKTLKQIWIFFQRNLRTLYWSHLRWYNTESFSFLRLAFTKFPNHPFITYNFLHNFLKFLPEKAVRMIRLGYRDVHESKYKNSNSGLWWY